MRPDGRCGYSLPRAEKMLAHREAAQLKVSKRAVCTPGQPGSSPHFLPVCPPPSGREELTDGFCDFNTAEHEGQNDSPQNGDNNDLWSVFGNGPSQPQRARNL